ncbi:MAG: hypothetical protein F6K26_10960 [Moorea sp. SIO2I5]|nr:hypothetical protein [Moorena sp. SIO2I5]
MGRARGGGRGRQRRSDAEVRPVMANAPRVTVGQGIARHHGSHLWNGDLARS